ncbi:hypothetical protein Bbelb_304880 [Branchiostoma belcheri]|nr:hypothetical protein Bbelb_304880 [Branchiostoma belcheri]
MPGDDMVAGLYHAPGPVTLRPLTRRVVVGKRISSVSRHLSSYFIVNSILLTTQGPREMAIPPEQLVPITMSKGNDQVGGELGVQWVLRDQSETERAREKDAEKDCPAPRLPCVCNGNACVLHVFLLVL